MKQHKAIKYLQNNAVRKNSIKAQYQLYKNYKDGLFVMPDRGNSIAFLDKVNTNFRTTQIRLKSIKLINFRGFAKVTIDLSTDYVVIAANNGYGKTGILESIYNGLTWLVKNFKTNGANGNFIRPEDVRVHAGVDAASIILDVSLMQGDIENSTYSINLSKTNDDAFEKQESFYQEFKTLADMYRELSFLGHNMPVLAFYSIERGNAIKKSDFKKTTEYLLKEFNSNDYYTNISTSPRFDVFLAWMYGEATSKAMSLMVNEANTLIESSLLTINTLKKLQSKDPSIQDVIEKLEKEVEKLSLKANPKINKTPNDKVSKIFSAIYKFMPEIRRLEFEYNEKTKSIDLTCMKNGSRISVSQLSQGEKTVLSLVCDISLRLISANGNQKEPFYGDGIVIIDEIDLHLHPLWQQTVLLRLRETFPNIQFILSTHSSNVLSTSSNECIRKLVPSESGADGAYDIEVPNFSLGAETSTLQEDIQGVSSRPESLEIIQKLFHYKKMVSDDEWDTPEAERIFAELCEWGENHDAIIKKLRLDVTLRKKRRERK